nr:MAG TPA: hypothetical protein [Caudoviricetes sp.]
MYPNLKRVYRLIMQLLFRWLRCLKVDGIYNVIRLELIIICLRTNGMMY